MCLRMCSIRKNASFLALPLSSNLPPVPTRHFQLLPLAISRMNMDLHRRSAIYIHVPPEEAHFF